MAQAVLTAGAISGTAGRLRERVERVFRRVEREIIPKDEGEPLDAPLFSVSIRRSGEDWDCPSGSDDETSYCQRIDVDDGAEAAVQIVLACSCPDRPERILLLCYLVDAVAERLRAILFQRKASFLLEDGFYFYGSGNGTEDEDTVALACLAAAYHQISRDMGTAFHLSTDAIDQLSLTNYEQEGARGVVLVAPQAVIDKIKPCVWLCRSATPATLSSDQIRFVRKLMAGAAPDALLFGVSPGEKTPRFCGVVSLSPQGLPPKALRFSCLQADIYGPMNWGLSLFGQPACLRSPTMGFRLPRGCSQADIDGRAKARIELVLRAEFGQASPPGPFYKNIAKTVQAVLAVRRQAHGAAAVVAAWTDPASCCKQQLDTLISHQKAIPVDFQPLPSSSKKLTAAITQAAKMDGAVLIDALSGEVYTLAVILDGPSCVDGSPSRGARYNSLKNFTCFMSKSNIVSFVFSSDGGMDIFSGQTFRDLGCTPGVAGRCPAAAHT